MVVMDDSLVNENPQARLKDGSKRNGASADSVLQVRLENTSAKGVAERATPRR